MSSIVPPWCRRPVAAVALATISLTAATLWSADVEKKPAVRKGAIAKAIKERMQSSGKDADRPSSGKTNAGPDRPAGKSTPERSTPEKPNRGEPVVRAGNAASRNSSAAGSVREQKDRIEPREMARRLDALLETELKKEQVAPSPVCNDEDFLRRVSLDLVGSTPSPEAITLFGLNTSPNKRAEVVDRLLASEEYARNWARYWRDVIYLRATEPRSRAAQPAFTDWMTAQLQQNRNWAEITTSLLTATGDVTSEGSTGLIFAHAAEPDEVASEVSRIFVGIQIQCANCHDHPSDQWKREQFHSLAAFFPRMRLQRKPDQGPLGFELSSLPAGMMNREGERRFDPDEIRKNPERVIALLDRNNDQQISKEEADRGPGMARFFPILLQQADSNRDGLISAKELKNLPAPMEQPGRGSPEHYMPDLQNPSSKGVLVNPALFLSSEKIAEGLSDLERRREVARLITSPSNPWFSKALVNRIWFELLGETFVLPVDDMGPERSARYPEMLDQLAAGFTASQYDLQWLFKTITSTAAYQRQIRHRKPSDQLPAMVAGVPSRLRADQLFDSLLRVLNLSEPALPSRQIGPAARIVENSPRGQFHSLFVIDPSTTPEEVTGTVPQALFLMNSPFLQGRINARSGPLADLLQKFPADADAIAELYLKVHSREPTAREREICTKYLSQAPSRGEGFEDLYWSLINSTEFQTRR